MPLSINDLPKLEIAPFDPGPDGDPIAVSHDVPFSKDVGCEPVRGAGGSR